MAGFLLNKKMDTSLESAFRDLHIRATIVALFSNGTKLIFLEYDFLDLHVHTIFFLYLHVYNIKNNNT